MTTLDRRKELDLAISRTVAAMAGGPAAFAKAREELLDLALSSLPAQAVGVKPLDTRAQAIWDAVEARIDAAPIDGISAEGQYSETVFNGQRLYVDGLRAGRLAAINALAPSQPAAVGERDDALWEQLLPLMQVEERPPGDPYKDKVAALALIEAALVHRDQVKL